MALLSLGEGWDGASVGWGLLFGVFSIIYCACEGDEINTKSRGGGWRLRLGVDGGSDCRKTGFPPCRLHHPHRHAVHDAIRHDGKKSGLRPFKKVRLSPVQKQLPVYS